MPIRALKLAIKSSKEIVKGVFDRIRGMPRFEYNYAKRLIMDGVKRDIIFKEGLTIGLQLSKLPKEDAKKLIDALSIGIERESNGKEVGGLFEKNELERIDSLLKNRLVLNARKRIISTIESGDAIFLNELIGALQKTFGL